MIHGYFYDVSPSDREERATVLDSAWLVSGRVSRCSAATHRYCSGGTGEPAKNHCELQLYVD